MAGLKPCPFCGEDVLVILKHPIYCENRIDSYQYQVVCDKHEGGCGGSSGCFDTISEAKGAWNMRSEKLSCYFKYCKDCASLIKRRIPDTEVAFEIRCGRKHKGIILKGEKLLSLYDITPEDFEKEEEAENE